jgi:hypothetical protein
VPSHLAAAVPTPSIGVPTSAPDLPDPVAPVTPVAPVVKKAAKHAAPVIAVTDFALHLLGPKGPQAAARISAPVGGPPSAADVPDAMAGPTVDLGGPRIVAPLGGLPASGSSLLAVLAGYVLPGGGAPPSTLVLFIVVGLILGIGLAGAPRGYERLALGRLVGASEGHSLAVPRPG